MLLLFILEASTRSRLWIDLWITLGRSARVGRTLTITETNTATFLSFPPQEPKNGFPLFLEGGIHMWAKCGKDVGPH